MALTNDVLRDQIFGLLAYRAGMIDHDVLRAALGARNCGGKRPVADELVRQQVLAPAACTAIELLVDAHVAAHGGVEQSLTALAGDASRRGQGEPHDDPDLTASFAGALHLADGRDHQAGATIDFVPSSSGPATAVGSATSDGRRFRFLRPHAEGGLGAVFVALDQELHREVALKQIQDRYADEPASRARFVMEAEITGALEHPGIVPVYGLGRHPDGRPFYAMRFIQGSSLKDVIAAFHAGDAAGNDPGARSLELRKLLRRFIDVCNAIEYAHRRGVLHRDIKPGNVMIGRYGETLVVDWGLAKVMGTSESRSGMGEGPVAVDSSDSPYATQPGAALGTPGYMSPEQAAGEIDQLGPASDVYSLGATLYCLLTGQPPFRREQRPNIAELLDLVRRGDFPPPRRVEPSIDPALEAVCLKAMATAAADRYGSAHALAEDVERWMADEPVSAYPEPRSRRAARWARRHAPLVTGAGALLTTAVIALGVSTGLISHEKRQVERARNALATSNQELARERDRADAARKDAETGYGLARDTVDRMFRDIAFGRLVNNPQTEKIRVELADEALQLYRQFAARRPNDPDLKLALGRVEGQAADRHRAVGDFDRARAGYVASLAILEPLCDQYPDRPDFLRRLAYFQGRFGELLLTIGRLSEAEPHSRAAVRLAGELSRMAPNDPLYASIESQALIDLAHWTETAGRDEETEAIRRRAVERARVVAARFAAKTAGSLSPGDRFLLPIALSGHAASLRKLRRTADAEAVLRELVAVHRADLLVHPGDNDTEYLLADALTDLGKLLTEDSARRAEALAAEDEAVGLATRLVSRFPEAAAYPQVLADFRAQRGLTRADAGNLDGARADLEAARSFFAGQASKIKDAPAPLQQLGKVTGDLGRLAARQGRKDEARDLLQRAIAAQERALELDPRSVADRELLARHRASLKSLDAR